MVYTGINSIYITLLGDYYDLGFTVREYDDPCDNGDKLAQIQFKGVVVGTYHRSKLGIRPLKEAQTMIQKRCKEFLTTFRGI